MTKTYTFKVEQDVYPESPRDWDNLTTFALAHGSYDLPNEANLAANGSFSTWEGYLKGLQIENDIVAVLPVYGYDHSGLFISTEIEPYWFHYYWDGGQLGYVYVTREQAQRTFNWERITVQRRKKLEEGIRLAVKEYAQYVINDVWQYVIMEDGEPLEYGGGYYSAQECTEAAIKEVESHKQQQGRIAQRLSA